MTSEAPSSDESRPAAPRGDGGAAAEPLFGLGGALPGLGAALVCGAGALGHGASAAAAVAGLLALPFAACSWLASSARAGRPVTGGRGLVAASCAAAVASPVLAVFGALLKANTHHRALAGVTFAVAGLGVVAGAAALGARLAQWSSARSPAALSAARAAAAGLASLSLLWLLARGGLLGPGKLDVAALFGALAAGWALRPRQGWGKASAALGVALPLLLCGLGLAQVSRADVARSVAARGLLAGALVLELHPEARPAAPSAEPGEHGSLDRGGLGRYFRREAPTRAAVARASSAGRGARGRAGITARVDRVQTRP